MTVRGDLLPVIYFYLASNLQTKDGNKILY